MNENTKKYLYVYGDLDYEIRDRIDVLKKSIRRCEKYSWRNL